jgi:hypothetical protein
MPSGGFVDSAEKDHSAILTLCGTMNPTAKFGIKMPIDQLLGQRVVLLPTGGDRLLQLEKPVSLWTETYRFLGDPENPLWPDNNAAVTTIERDRVVHRVLSAEGSERSPVEIKLR